MDWSVAAANFMYFYPYSRRQFSCEKGWWIDAVGDQGLGCLHPHKRVQDSFKRGTLSHHLMSTSSLYLCGEEQLALRKMYNLLSFCLILT